MSASIPIGLVDPQTLKAWLHDGREIALLDVREHGQFGEAHPFHAVSVPYSRLEFEVRRLVPRLSTRVVLLDEGGDSDVAARAAASLRQLGYDAPYVLRGGVAAWRTAGYACFAGVNVPSKTFGELAELAFHTPHIGARELAERVARGEDLVILDGRPPAEFAKMNIPGGVCCPNGELALRAEAMVRSPETTIVVNCAGRTRSIIGAQTLINLGIRNPVYALENGTQGWFLEGLPLEHGASRRYPESVDEAALETRRARALALARRSGVRFIETGHLHDWLADGTRTTFLLDVRTAEEFARGSLPGAAHAPGGQLLQATDQYAGVRKARLVLFDGEEIRAPVVASWLIQMGWEASVLRVAADALTTVPARAPDAASIVAAVGDVVSPAALCDEMRRGARLVDVRPSAAYRACHPRDAVWSIRPRLSHLGLGSHDRVVLIADDARVAALAAAELRSSTGSGLSIGVHLGDPSAWDAAGVPTSRTPEVPPDVERIDYLFFVHDRHDGNRAAALKYLEWETGLVAQIDAQERADFHFAIDKRS